MVMSRILCCMILISVVSACYTGNGAGLAAAVTEGAQAGITLAISLGGSLCLWSGVGKLMECAGITAALSRLIRPLLHRIFPSTRTDSVLAGQLSGNICANFLGLGNAATPMGIQAVKSMSLHTASGSASDEMCRLIVLNTASIQLIPATVAAVRASLGCSTPFDILPAVWITSLSSASLGVTAAWYLGKVWHHD
ncbi:MAG: spore maturation protein A [Oscillospiraceae bacterium]|nr:spore maturation protein A [Oscillospiraceae bacterium]